MIIVKVYGGLAGQMMQYAFACFLELKRREEVKIDISFFGGQARNNSFRKFELINWNTKFCIASEEDYNYIFSKVKLKDKINYRLFKKEVENRNYFREKLPFRFDPDVLNTDYSIFDGYWVNHDYIDQVKGRLLKDFTPRYPISDKNKEVLHMMESSNSVSIHFRRGDYVDSIHDVLKKDYYTEAIDHIKQTVENPRFFVFSDDLEFVKHTYEFPGEALFIDHNKLDESYWDIFLMSKCRHNVIANSGFSYWGAWLNQHKNAIVVAPSNWMETENSISDNLLLKHWHII